MSIVVSNLTKIFGTQTAVDSINFSLKKGEIAGFLGPNGAGKSTTMKMITGYLPPTDGKIIVAGHDVAAQPMEVRKKIGYLPEANPLYFDMYVREFLEFSAGVHKLEKPAARIAEMIDLTGLGKEAHKKIGMLSKGYKQRVGLAQAMLHNPEVLILDEPTSGLDPNQLVEIRELIVRIGKEKTVLLSTHIMQEVQAMCTRALIISGGRLVADSSIADLQKTGSQGTIILELETPVKPEKLTALPFLDRCETLKNNSYKLYTAQPEKTRKAIMEWALANNVNIVGLRSETQSLEEVFRVLTKE